MQPAREPGQVVGRERVDLRFTPNNSSLELQTRQFGFNVPSSSEPVDKVTHAPDRDAETERPTNEGQLCNLESGPVLCGDDHVHGPLGDAPDRRPSPIATVQAHGQARPVVDGARSAPSGDSVRGSR